MKEEKEKKSAVFMWGYLPGATPQRTPILSPEKVSLPESYGDSWKDVCGGGCGFANALSGSGKLMTWGSTDELGQGYATAWKHEETPGAYPLPAEASIVTASAGWAHCAAVTEKGEVYAWGWKECVPTGKVMGDLPTGDSMEHNGSLSEQVCPASHINQSVLSQPDTVCSSGHEHKGGEEGSKRRRLSVTKQNPENSTTIDESMSALPCLVTLNPGVRIATVAAGGRHTLALSDMGKVWGWGYGGEGQLGLGSRIRMVSSPHPIACIEPSSYGRDRSSAVARVGPNQHVLKPSGSYVKAIACGGRHSAAITDAGALLTFGWGLYGQCGNGSTDDELNPTCVSSLCGIPIGGVAAGLWHTICVSVEGQVYAFGGNQFGQLGTGSDQAEINPRLLDAPLKNKKTKAVSCGARHTAIITGSGEVFCWGWNKYGQLGLGDSTDRSTPCQVKLDGGASATNIACGWWHTLLLADSPT